MTGYDQIIRFEEFSNDCNNEMNEFIQKKCHARKRWQLLRQAIRKQCSTSNFLQSPGSKCNITRYTKVSHHCYRAMCTTSNLAVNIRVPVPSQPISPQQLMGFDNTGNICVWSSEEVLLQYCVAAAQQWTGKRVLEIAGGSTALAGLWLSATGVCSQVTLSDGHPDCVENIRQCVALNLPLPTPTLVRRLQWGGGEYDGCYRTHMNSSGGGSDNEDLRHQQYDVILAADCVFSYCAQAALSALLWCLLPAGGELVLVAPHRYSCGGSSLTKFAEVMAEKGFVPSSSAHVSSDVHAALKKVGRILTENDRPHLLLLQKPFLN